MSKVFFGGSRRVTRLSESVKERVDNIISESYFILVGDANGADRAVQQYLAERNYQHVIVFCMGDECRNNLGNWPTRHIHSSRTKKDFAYYSTKDVAMSDEADYGFMLWDGKSKGTLNNVLNLCERGKKVLVYFSPTRSSHAISTFEDIPELLRHCDEDSLRRFDQALSVDRRIHSGQRLFDFG